MWLLFTYHLALSGSDHLATLVSRAALKIDKRHKLENNTLNSVLDSCSNKAITKKICPKGPKLFSAKCMALASLHCSNI
jgi:hypothetical protein